MDVDFHWKKFRHKNPLTRARTKLHIVLVDDDDYAKTKEYFLRAAEKKLVEMNELRN